MKAILTALSFLFVAGTASAENMKCHISYEDPAQMGNAFLNWDPETGFMEIWRDGYREPLVEEKWVWAPMLLASFYNRVSQCDHSSVTENGVTKISYDCEDSGTFFKMKITWNAKKKSGRVTGLTTFTNAPDTVLPLEPIPTSMGFGGCKVIR